MRCIAKKYELSCAFYVMSSYALFIVLQYNRKREVLFDVGLAL